MADKLTPQQQVQLDVLATLPPRFETIHRLIEEIAALRADDAMIRRLCRLLEAGKSAANSVGQTALADTLGTMGTIARRGGDPARLIADPATATRALGWQPERSELATIIEDALRSRRGTASGRLG